MKRVRQKVHQKTEINIFPYMFYMSSGICLGNQISPQKNIRPSQREGGTFWLALVRDEPRVLACF